MQEDSEEDEGRDTSEAPFLWVPEAARLEFVPDDHALPERASPIRPQVIDGEEASEQSYPQLAHQLSETLTSWADSLIGLVVSAVSVALMARENAQMDGAKRQIGVLENILREVGIRLNPIDVYRDFVWQEAAQGISLALLDGLATAPVRELMTPELWAKHTWAVIDPDDFADSTGLRHDEAEQLLALGAASAHSAVLQWIAERQGTAVPPLVRYRDRWILLCAFSAGGFSGFDIEILNPYLAMSVKADQLGRRQVVPLVAADLFATAEGLRLVTLTEEANEQPISIELPMQDQSTDAILATSGGGLLSICLSDDPWIEGRPSDLIAVGEISVLLDISQNARASYQNIEPSSQTFKTLTDDETSRHALVAYHITDRPGILLGLMKHFENEGIDVVTAVEATVGSTATVGLLLSLDRPVARVELNSIASLESSDELKYVIRDKFCAITVDQIETPSPTSASSTLWNIWCNTADRRGVFSALSSLIARHDGRVRRAFAATKPLDVEPDSFEFAVTVELPSGANLISLKSSLGVLCAPLHTIHILPVDSVLDFWLSVPSPSPAVDDWPAIVVMGRGGAPGLEVVAQRLYDGAFNIIGASTVSLGPNWTGVFVVSSPSLKDASNLEKITAQAAESLREVGVEAKDLPRPETEGPFLTGHRYDVRINVLSRPGVLIPALEVLAAAGCNVESVYAYVRENVKPAVGAIRLAVMAPEHLSLTDLEDQLAKIEAEEGWISFKISLLQTGPELLSVS